MANGETWFFDSEGAHRQLPWEERQERELLKGKQRMEREERRNIKRWKVEQRKRFLARRNGWYGVLPGVLHAGDVVEPEVERGDL